MTQTIDNLNNKVLIGVGYFIAFTLAIGFILEMIMYYSGERINFAGILVMIFLTLISFITTYTYQVIISNKRI